MEAEQREARKFEAQRAKDAERVRTVMQREVRKQEAILEKEKKAEERKRQAEDRKKWAPPATPCCASAAHAHTLSCNRPACTRCAHARGCTVAGKRLAI